MFSFLGWNYADSIFFPRMQFLPNRELEGQPEESVIRVKQRLDGPKECLKKMPWC